MTDTPESPAAAAGETIAYATVHRPGGIGREIFGVIVRTFGLILVLWGIYSIAYMAVSFGLSIPQSGYSALTFAVFGLIYFGMGIALIKGEWLVRFAYDIRSTRDRT